MTEKIRMAAKKLISFIVEWEVGGGEIVLKGAKGTYIFFPKIKFKLFLNIFSI